jgi:hypothetical protein
VTPVNPGSWAKAAGQTAKRRFQIPLLLLNQIDQGEEKVPGVFSRPAALKDHSRAWRNETSFGLNDLEALLKVAREAKEWISNHALKH